VEVIKKERVMATVKSMSKAMPAKSRMATAKEIEQRMRKARSASILLKQVSDPTRLQVIMMLSEGERHVGALCEFLNQSQPAVSHHLALLRHGGIISPRRQGKNNFYSLTPTGGELAKVVKYLVS
jgi:DNA-binding transcriptional ArsR family regulator